MSSAGDLQVWEGRINRLESEISQLRCRCRRQALALATIAAVALATPAILLIVTSFGSELRVRTVVAERVVLPTEGAVIIGGEKNSARTARLGYNAADSEFGLSFFDGENRVIRLRAGDNFPSLTFQAKNTERQLRIGVTGQVSPSVSEVVGDPALEILGTGGIRRISLSVAGSDDPYLIFWDGSGARKCAEISSKAGYFSRMTLWSPSPKELESRMELSSYPGATLFDSKGKERLRLELNRDPSLLLLDENGKEMPLK